MTDRRLFAAVRNPAGGGGARRSAVPRAWRSAGGLLALLASLAAPLAPFAAAQTPAPTRGLTLAEARHQALARGWDLLAAKSDLDIARAQAIVAREIQNPSLQTTLTQIPTDGARAGTPRGNGVLDRSYDTTLAISQLLEVHGERRLRRSSAAAGVTAAEARFQDARRLLDAAVVKGYAAAALAEANGRLLAETAASLARSAGIAAARLHSGDISAAEEAQVEVEAERFAVEARASEAEAQSARLALDVLLGEPRPQGDWHAVDALEALAPVAARLEPGTAAGAERPDLAAARAAQEKAEADLRLERARRLPDPTVSLQYERQPPERSNSVGFGVSLDLPLLSRRQGEIASALALRDQAALARERLAATASSEQSAATAAFTNARQRFASYRDRLLPKAEQARDAVVYAYQHGGASLLQLLEAERSANDLRLALAKSAADTVSAAADVAAAFNLPLSIDLP